MSNDFQSRRHTFISTSSKKIETVTEAKQNKYLFIYLFILFFSLVCLLFVFGGSIGS